MNIKHSKIFLVDDQKIVNFINLKILSRVGLAENVSEFTDPSVAFEKLVEEKPTVTFLDLNMPDLNGWDFLEKMNEISVNSKVIILTSSTSKLDQLRAKKYSQVIDYYIKPLNIEVAEKFLNLLKNFN